jgi:hypothetical protein
VARADLEGRVWLGGEGGTYRGGLRGGGGNQESDFRSTKVFGVRVKKSLGRG